MPDAFTCSPIDRCIAMRTEPCRKFFSFLRIGPFSGSFDLAVNTHAAKGVRNVSTADFALGQTYPPMLSETMAILHSRLGIDEQKRQIENITGIDELEW